MDNKRSVLVLMPCLFRGGSEKQVRYIIEGLEKKGVPVVALIESGEKTTVENNTYVEKHGGINFVFLNQHINNEKDKTIINKIKSINKISRWMLKNLRKYNVKWVMFTNLTGLLMTPVCKLKGCYVLFNERNPGIKMCNSASKRRLLKKCDKVVANSKSASEYMSEILKREVECINNGVEIPDLSEKNCVYDHKNKTILVPARITPIKNQMIIIKAIALLKKKLDIKVLFLGEIEDENYYKEIENAIKSNELEEQVEFLGFVHNMNKYYEMSDLVLLASYEEGTPNIMLEAFLHKKSCLASDIIMNRNVCVDENILFDPNDYKILSEKILWILDLDETTREHINCEHYNFIKNNYSMEKMQQRYFDIFSM